MAVEDRRQADVPSGVARAGRLVSVPLLAGLALSGHGALHSFTDQASRSVEIESTAATILFALGHLGFSFPHVHLATASWGLSAPTRLGLGALGLVGLVALVAITVLVWRRPDPRQLVLGSLAAIVVFMATGKVLSPQYLIWAIPLFALAAAGATERLPARSAAAMILTFVDFPRHFHDLGLPADAVACGDGASQSPLADGTRARLQGARRRSGCPHRSSSAHQARLRTGPPAPLANPGQPLADRPLPAGLIRVLRRRPKPAMTLISGRIFPPPGRHGPNFNPSGPRARRFSALVCRGRKYETARRRHMSVHVHEEAFTETALVSRGFTLADSLAHRGLAEERPSLARDHHAPPAGGHRRPGAHARLRDYRDRRRIPRRDTSSMLATSRCSRSASPSGSSCPGPQPLPRRQPASRSRLDRRARADHSDGHAWSWAILLGISATGVRHVTIPKLALFWVLTIALLLLLRSAASLWPGARLVRPQRARRRAAGPDRGGRAAHPAPSRVRDQHRRLRRQRAGRARPGNGADGRAVARPRPDDPRRRRARRADRAARDRPRDLHARRKGDPRWPRRCARSPTSRSIST